MSQTLKVLRKNFTLPQTNSSDWKFEKRPGGWIIATSKEGIRRRFVMQEKKGKLSLSLRGILWSGEWIQKSRDLGGGEAANDLVAQFPGKVRKILVSLGQKVEEGEALLLVEAMKMEFSVKAPFPGFVKEIKVKEGQQLSPGDLLIDLEEGK